MSLVQFCEWYKTQRMSKCNFDDDDDEGKDERSACKRRRYLFHITQQKHQLSLLRGTAVPWGYKWNYHNENCELNFKEVHLSVRLWCASYNTWFRVSVALQIPSLSVGWTCVMDQRIIHSYCHLGIGLRQFSQLQSWTLLNSPLGSGFHCKNLIHDSFGLFKYLCADGKCYFYLLTINRHKY